VAILDLSSAVTRKRCKIETKSPLTTNRKSYTRNRLVPFSMTLSDLYRSFQGHDTFGRGIIQNDENLSEIDYRAISSDRNGDSRSR